MATPFSPGPRRGTPRSVELRCEAFVFFPSVDFYSRPREMRSGELPRLRPPRVESWRARRGGLEGAGKSGMAWPDFDDHQLLITITCAFAASTRGPGRFNIHAAHRFDAARRRAGRLVLVFHTLQGHNLLRRARFERPFPTQVTNRKA